MRCWNCQAQTQGRPFCASCSKIAPRPAGATHFDAFGLPPAVDVDLPALEKQYRELSMKLHPDRYAQADARERRLSLEQTTALNDAYKTLRDPVRRAFYLLELSGVDLDREDGGAARPQLPVEFLEEVIELREQLQGADLGRAQQLAAEVERKRKGALAEAQEALREVARGADRHGSGVDPAVERATRALARVRYFQRFVEEVAAREEEAL